MTSAFAKMHGLGNDFMVMEMAEDGSAPSPATLRAWADRHTGVGFDQLLLIGPSDVADAAYRVFNADGQEVEQCANGARCVARFVAEREHRNRLTLASRGGLVTARVNSDGQVTLGLGEPDFHPAALPFTADPADRYQLNVAGREIVFGAVSMGNPHAVILVDSVDTAPVGILGPALEHHECFPRGVNVGFVRNCQPATHSAAGARAGRGRNPGLRNRCRRRGGGWQALGFARRGCGGCASGRRTADTMARPGRGGWSDRPYQLGLQGTSRVMSQKGQAVLAERFSEADVADYLSSHPEFFDSHPQLLEALRLPHRAGLGAVSLVERQVTVLRSRNTELERKLKDLIGVARANDQLVGKIHRLAVRLMAADSLRQRLDTIEAVLREEFAADQAVLVLFGEPASAESLHHGRFLRVVAAGDGALGPFATFLKSGRARCGQIRDSQRDFVFGPDAAQIASAALVPLGAGAEQGFLVIGSRDLDHFHPGKSIDFLERIGELVTVALAAA